LRLKNLNNLLHFDIADAGISPTVWQASTFPEDFRRRIRVVHDGIDTAALAPDPEIRFTFQGDTGEGITLSRSDEVITFVNRNLEPYRGYHIFMRALPRILRERAEARVLIVGGNDVSYGAKPSKERYGERSWKDIFAEEARKDIPDEAWKRVVFLGNLSYPHFVALLQVSRVHVYLTYPFVLSWSLLEAMSLGCAIVASDTAPVREAIAHGRTGRLVDFFGVEQLANEVTTMLDDAALRLRLGSAACAFAREHYDLRTVCLPRQLEWVAALAGQGV
jgi:glycosyltransferase involved in cell wall biosynthesis